MNVTEALQIFELVPPVSKTVLKRAYRDALMVWHPDRFIGNDDLRKKAEQKTYLINEAYSLLSRISETDYPYCTRAEQNRERHSRNSTSAGAHPSQNETSRPQAQPSNQQRNPATTTSRHKSKNETHAKGATRAYTVAAWIATASVAAFFIYVFNQPSFHLKPNSFDSGHGTASKTGLDSLIKKAESGDLEAQKDMGIAYLNGIGIDKDEAKAVVWFTKAAEKGHALAQHNLGVCYYTGSGVPAEPETAIKWFRRAANQNLADSQFNLGISYASGYGVTNDNIEARMWFELAALQGPQPALPADKLQSAIVELESKMTPAEIAEAKRQASNFKSTSIVTGNEDQRFKTILLLAEAGDAESQFTLYAYYRAGKYVDKDQLRAVEWLKRAAELGHAKAQTQLGVNYTIGDLLPKDSSQAIKWFRLAAESQDADAQYQLAECYANGDGIAQDHVAAAKWFLAAAKQGNIDAQKQLGWALCNGIGVTKDPTEGLLWLQRAAEKGDSQAMLDIGLYHSNIANDAEAFNWVNKAALKGDISAQFLLGLYYYEGVGVAVDWSQAAKWYQIAASQGSAQAQSFLGSCYAKGEGVPYNRTLAYMWLSLAKQNGGQGSAETMAAIENDLTPEEVAKAKELVAGFKSTNDLNTRTDTGPKLKNNESVIGSSKDESKILTPSPNIFPKDEMLRHLPTDNRLTSGLILVDRLQASHSHGKLTVDNGLAEDAHVKLTADGKLAASFYVRGGQQFTFDHIPDGSYQLLYCTGYGWNSDRRDFSRGRNAARYDSQLIFVTRQKTEGNQVIVTTDVLTLTLHKVINGNAKASAISLAEFDQY